ncbi:Leucine Rich Repeat family protein, expressed [Trichuris trichiura]|uniref:Leucine Rich Repeat family protein, expressed n=1 Tax=Trichuris trichiura TaxID=36087 RepID=A0A077ZK45_TRITR|nr:Leucine Rich Repeat family protein, expressed [Trichuris trichiura]
MPRCDDVTAEMCRRQNEDVTVSVATCEYVGKEPWEYRKRVRRCDDINPEMWRRQNAGATVSVAACEYVGKEMWEYRNRGVTMSVQGWEDVTP